MVAMVLAKLVGQMLTMQKYGIRVGTPSFQQAVDYHLQPIRSGQRTPTKAFGLLEVLLIQQMNLH